MVRFKNRHILVEFLQPSSLAPAFNSSGTTRLESTSAIQISEEEAQNEPSGLDDDDEAILQPQLPFMIPLPSDSTKSRLNLGDDGGSVIYRAVRGSVQEVYGDEGWGRIASSFKIIYHSPLTTLTILRIPRQHYRLLWSAITFLTSIQGQAVLPRVVAVSGTIKKLQNTAIVYHRQVTGRMVAVALEREGGLAHAILPNVIGMLTSAGASHTAREKEKQLEKGWENERRQIQTLED